MVSHQNSIVNQIICTSQCSALWFLFPDDFFFLSQWLLFTFCIYIHLLIPRSTPNLLSKLTKSSPIHFYYQLCPLKYQPLFLLANCLLVLLANKKQKSHRATSKTPTHAASAAIHRDIKETMSCSCHLRCKGLRQSVGVSVPRI